jgi:HD-GYP domain-containing protein (c-di-GMP phosphodiesterase class II)
MKPGPLNAQENEEMKRHATIGYRIARSSPRLAHVAESVLAHHERWDGAGYPMGMAAEDIPLAARLVAIADAFDSMTHATPYRPPLSRRTALDEIMKGAGSKFDPALVEAFMKTMSPSSPVAANADDIEA